MVSFSDPSLRIILSRIIYNNIPIIPCVDIFYLCFSRRVYVAVKQNTADHQWYIAACAKNEASGQSEVFVWHEFPVSRQGVCGWRPGADVQSHGDVRAQIRTLGWNGRARNRSETQPAGSRCKIVKLQWSKRMRSFIPICV